MDHLATYMFLNQSKVIHCYVLRVYDISDCLEHLFTVLSLFRYPFSTHSFSRLYSPYTHTHTHTHLSDPQEKPTVILIRTHIASEPDVLHQLMGSLFNTLLLTSHANHWAITRAILSLMLASESSFAGTKNT